VVKKGDTLYRIGLEFGYDYREIAAVNNLVAPYPIKVGQTLKLPHADANSSPAPTPQETAEGVVITPISTDAPTPTVETKPVASAVIPVLTQPKATREVYSTEAFNKKPSNPIDPVAITKKPGEGSNGTASPEVSTIKPTVIKPVDDESIYWVWPTNGKVIRQFNEAANKGIDIAGTTGQAINAASSGKVIYSGSDLRGYGKLVIVKHNKTYLSVYAHNSKILVKEGQMVSAGQKIAEMGNTDSNAVKLHFEIRQQGKSVDPMKYLTKN
jgi:lipoprotein NlpD